MKIKICGIFREQDIDYINEARPDYMGFVFATSKREVSFAQAAHLRERLTDGITPVGVFVNAAVEDIIALYRDGVISIAQLHGNEDDKYIAALKEASAKTGLDPIPVIKVIKSTDLEQQKNFYHGEHGVSRREKQNSYNNSSVFLRGYILPDYYLLDSGAGSGQPFNWDILKPGSPYASWLQTSGKPWFLAGGINAGNIAEAMSFNPFCIDVSGGVETSSPKEPDGIKDREKIVQLVKLFRNISF